MSTEQEKDLVKILNRMGTVVVNFHNKKDVSAPEYANAFARLEYLAWESRKALGLPDIEGFGPF